MGSLAPDYLPGVGPDARAPLKRDVVLLATADEEDGSYKGMRWIAEHKPEWLDAEYGLSEGGGSEITVGDRSFSRAAWPKKERAVSIYEPRVRRDTPRARTATTLL